MNLETFFTKEDIKQIYELVTIYSLTKYQTLSPIWQSTFQAKYQNALSNLEKLNINIHELEQESVESLYAKLENYQTLYNSLREQNKTIIDSYAPQIETKITETIHKYPTELKKVSFLFQFITEYITYSEDYFNYCLQVPPIDGFTFDFKENVPVDSEINGLLIMRQGLCDDISNLMVYLGRKLNLNIRKIFSIYNGNHHSLNTITIDDQIYLMYATRRIRQEKTIEDCFLVSESTLNKEKNYEFHSDIEKTIDYKGELPNYQKEILNLIQELNTKVPQVTDLNQLTPNSLKR